MLICTRCRAAHLDHCLRKVAGLRYPNFDVLVIDNSRGDAETRKVAERWCVRYVVQAGGGLSHARNYGSRMTDADIVAYTDDDAFPDSQWLSALARQFADPLVMAVAGRTLALRPSADGGAAELVSETADSPLPQRVVFDAHTPGWFELANFGGIGDGMNMALRLSAFDICPGFDERLGRGAILGGYEEHHAFFSLIDRGYRVVYAPDAIVSHPFARSEREHRAHQITDTAALTGYITLLLVEQPRYRRALLSFVMRALRRALPRLRRAQGTVPPGVIPRWTEPFLWLWGPVLYLRSLVSSGKH